MKWNSNLKLIDKVRKSGLQKSTCMEEERETDLTNIEEPGVIYDLKVRLENFAATIIVLYDVELKTFSRDYLAKQLIRSSCSSVLNYSEALGADTSKDKINKLSICLKELRESETNLNIQSKANLNVSVEMENLKNEVDQLIRIVVTRIRNLKSRI